METLLDWFTPHIGQLTFGALAGFAVGYAGKKVGRMALIALGLVFVLVQGLAYMGWIHIDWKQIESGVEPLLERSALRHGWDVSIAFLTHNLPFGATFVPGFIAGLRFG